MKFFHQILSVIVIVTIVLASLFSSAGLVYGMENIDQFERSYLSENLKNIAKFYAPKNQGLKYFLLPDSADLKNIPTDPNNPLTSEKIRLGQFLFHETALSINPINAKHWQQSSCASCHFAQAGFRSNLKQALGVGGLGWNQDRHQDSQVFATEVDKQNILTPSVLNSAYQNVTLWDGRLGVTGPNSKEALVQEFDVNRFGFDGLETQAIDAMNVHHLGTAAIASIPRYQELFAQAFPDRPYVKAEVEDLKRTGMAIAAYERTLLPNQSPFQKWLKGDEQAMSQQELRGAIVFFESSCIHCHTGPNLASQAFYSVGFADHPDDFSGLNLGRGTITKRARDDFKFKVPQLYNLADSSPHGHGASFKSLREVVEYFNRGHPQKMEAFYSGNLSVWFRPLHLTQQQIADLTVFLETGLRDPNLMRYVPEALPSGLCFPNNDPESRRQLNCP